VVHKIERIHHTVTSYKKQSAKCLCRIVTNFNESQDPGEGQQQCSTTYDDMLAANFGHDSTSRQNLSQRIITAL